MFNSKIMLKKGYFFVIFYLLLTLSGVSQINFEEYNCYMSPISYKWRGEPAKGILCWMVYKDTSLYFLNYSLVMVLDREHGNLMVSADTNRLPINVYDVKISQDSRYAALLEVGEGHPWIEILDLQNLIDTGEAEIVANLNPYPGGIDILHWEAGKLWVETDIDLSKKNQHLDLVDTDISEERLIFSFDPQTGLFHKEKLKK